MIHLVARLVLTVMPFAVYAGDVSPGVAQAYPGERLGTVSFAVSCAPSVRSAFNRGVALLHDFWYEEARPQFEEILHDDPSCAMAHWGIAMSGFHQIWDRPDEAASRRAANELQAARVRPAKLHVSAPISPRSVVFSNGQGRLSDSY